MEDCSRHSPGPAAANAQSTKVPYVRVTTHVRLAVKRSRRSRASATIRLIPLLTRIHRRLIQTKVASVIVT